MMSHLGQYIDEMSTYREDTNTRLRTLEQFALENRIERAEMRGAMKVIKALPYFLAAILSALGYDLVGHHLGWFTQLTKAVAP